MVIKMLIRSNALRKSHVDGEVFVKFFECDFSLILTYKLIVDNEEIRTGETNLARFLYEEKSSNKYLFVRGTVVDCMYFIQGVHYDVI